jgi:hypothetical protein
MSVKEKKEKAPASPAARPLFAVSSGFWLKILVVVQLGFFAAEFSPDISTNGDDAKYYMLGKSLISGNGYRDQYDPQTPVHTQYPPLFPAYIGIAGAGTNTPLVPKIAVGILSACVLLLLFRYLRLTGGNLTLPVVLITALSASFATHATLLMSECPYLFTTLAALVLLDRYRRSGGTGLAFWAAALVAVMPAFIRTVGIAFVAAWLAANVIDKKYRQAAAHLLLFIGAMLLLRLATSWHSSYADFLLRKNAYDPDLGFLTLAEMVARIGQNIYQYLFVIIPRLLLGVDLSKNASVAVSLMYSIPAGIGLIRNFALPATRFLSLYLLFYAGILSMWQPQWTTERMIIPVIPFLAYIFLLGLQTLPRLFALVSGKKETAGGGGRFTTGAIWTAALLIAAFNLSAHFRVIETGNEKTADWKNFYGCADWMRLNTPKDAIVVSRKPELFYLRSLRKGFIYPYSHDKEKVMAAMNNGRARYCVLDNFFWTGTTGRYLYPAIISHAEKFRVVYSLHNPETYVLEMVP